MKIKINSLFHFKMLQLSWSIFVFISFVIFCHPMQSLACSTASGFNPPTVKHNYDRSESIFFGTVEKKSENKDGTFELQVKVVRTWKGKSEAKKKIGANPSNTCDGFSASASVGTGCVFFVSGDNQVVSGVRNGNASVCGTADQQTSQSLMMKYDAQFKSFQSKKSETDPEIASCEKKGGRWEGRETGRGRLTGCNLPTKDGGKACEKGNDCESVCLSEGKCHGWQKYKGCGHFRGHESMMCVD